MNVFQYRENLGKTKLFPNIQFPRIFQFDHINFIEFPLNFQEFSRIIMHIHVFLRLVEELKTTTVIIFNQIFQNHNKNFTNFHENLKKTFMNLPEIS